MPVKRGPTDGAARALAGVMPPLAWLTITDSRSGRIRRLPLRSNGAIFRAREACRWGRLARPWCKYAIRYAYGGRDAQADTDGSVR